MCLAEVGLFVLVMLSTANDASNFIDQFFRLNAKKCK